MSDPRRSRLNRRPWNRAMWRSLAILLALPCSALSDPRSAAAQQADWYRWRGPNQTGVSIEADWSHDWEGKPPVIWRQEVGLGFSSCVVSGNRLYTMGHRQEQTHVVCLQAHTGQRLWQYSYPAALDDRDFEGGTISTPTIDGRHLYVLSRVGKLLCLEAEGGQLVWEIDAADRAGVRVPGWGFSAAPLVVGERIILGIGESGAAFDKRDGTLLWSSRDREAGYGTPVLLETPNQLAAIFSSARAYIGVDLADGRQLWSQRWLTTFGCNAADAIVDGDSFLLSSGYNRGSGRFRLEEGQPQLVWKHKDFQNQLHASLLYQGHLYGIDGDMQYGARLKCVSWSHGEILWNEDDLRPGGLTLAGGRLLLLTSEGELVIARADPVRYDELARGRVLDGKCWTVPVLCGGRVYCRSIAGQLACVDLRRNIE